MKVKNTKEMKKQMMIMKDSGSTYQEIGSLFNISRQRVHQLLRAPRILKNEVYSKSNGKCAICGNDIKGKAIIHHENYENQELKILCRSCHTRLHHLKNKRYCKECNKEIKVKGKRYCSSKCRYEYYHPLLICSYCGRIFRRHINSIRASLRYRFDNVFCNKQCAGLFKKGKPLY